MSDNKQVFSPGQRSLLTAVINRIIPAKDKLPGAGNLGIAASIEEAAATTPGLTRIFNDGLAQIGVAAGQSSAGEFEALSNTAKDELLRSVETANPVFFDQLVLQTYNGYYTNPEVFELIGYSLPRLAPPGSQPELLDVSLLDEQRKREPFWKKV
ncbi:MAG: gluconate 2-dehydrogenase subunit 3 family protein [Chloroflexi bacterium]|nr:gluconate 2-dehydrogenase subunit 3 family protein [Chloroflexota bacterium]